MAKNSYKVTTPEGVLTRNTDHEYTHAVVTTFTAYTSKWSGKVVEPKPEINYCGSYDLALKKQAEQLRRWERGGVTNLGAIVAQIYPTEKIERGAKK